MDMDLLRKKLSTYKAGKSGRITKVPDELSYEILLAWEAWSGPATGFYKELGVSYKKMARVLGRAKKLKREGHFPEDMFKEIKLSPSIEPSSVSEASFSGITMRWEKGRIIKFSQVVQLVEFLNTMERQKSA